MLVVALSACGGGYFYTTSVAEHDLVLASRPDMRYEGSSFAVASPDDLAAVPIHRLASLNNGAYLYTASLPEREAALALGFWRDEASRSTPMRRPARRPARKRGRRSPRRDC